MGTDFKYLGRILTASDNYWPAVVANMWKSQKQWTRLSWIIGWERSDPRTCRTFYKVFFQVTLIFGADNWFISTMVGKTLDRFHHRVALQLVGFHPRQDISDRWIYPHLYASMTEVGLEEVEIYVLRCQNTVAQYIMTRPIL